MGQDAIIEGAASAAEQTVVADAAARGAGARRRRREGAPGPCRNCAAPLQGAHCHVCGQVADDMRRPVWELVYEALEQLLSLDGRFWRTLPALIFIPGRVTRRYLDGQRARYVQPFRLFLFASLVFFLIAASASGDLTRNLRINADQSGTHIESSGELERAQRDLEAAAEKGGPAAAGLSEAAQALKGAAEQEKARSEPKPGEGARGTEQERAKCAVRDELLPERDPSPRCQALRDANGGDWGAEVELPFGGLSMEMREGLASRIETVIDRPEAYVAAMQRWAPRLVFVLFPIYALFLAVLHVWRRDLLFYDHLVASLHFHAFLFVFILLLMLAGFVIHPGWLAVVFVVWSNVYLYRMMRVVYGDARILAVFRVIVLDFAYLFLLLFALILLMLLGVVFV